MFKLYSNIGGRQMMTEELTGKQLGIAVAKEVMGWTEQRDIYSYDGPYPAFTIGGDYLCKWHSCGEDRSWHNPGEDRGWYAWAPWRDMNDAWEVVEKIGSMSFSVKNRFVDMLPLTVGDQQRWQIEPLWAFLFVVDVPMAILRAALKAVRGGENG
jgi:hypothetical protein